MMVFLTIPAIAGLSLPLITIYLVRKDRIEYVDPLTGKKKSAALKVFETKNTSLVLVRFDIIDRNGKKTYDVVAAKNIKDLPTVIENYWRGRRNYFPIGAITVWKPKKSDS